MLVLKAPPVAVNACIIIQVYVGRATRVPSVVMCAPLVSMFISHHNTGLWEDRRGGRSVLTGMGPHERHQSARNVP